MVARDGLRSVPGIKRESPYLRHPPQRRRTADADHRPRAGHQSAAAPHGRTFRRPVRVGHPTGGGGLPPTKFQRHGHLAGRAESGDGSIVGAPRLHFRQRPNRPGIAGRHPGGRPAPAAASAGGDRWQWRTPRGAARGTGSRSKTGEARSGRDPRNRCRGLGPDVLERCQTSGRSGAAKEFVRSAREQNAIDVVAGVSGRHDRQGRLHRRDLRHQVPGPSVH